MTTFLDLCFCFNNECKKRDKCARALENYEDTKSMNISMAHFECKGKKTNMFIKLSKIKKNIEK